MFIAAALLLILAVNEAFSAQDVTVTTEQNVVAADANVAVKETVAPEKSVKPANERKEEVKKLDQDKKTMQEALKKQKNTTGEAKKEEQKAVAEKQELEKELAIKEQAAIVAQEKLAASKKEAEKTKDSKALAEAERLAVEAQHLEKEFSASKERLAAAEARAKTAKDNITANETKIVALQKALTDIKKEKAAKRSFFEKSIASLIVIVIGVILFLLLNLGMRYFEKIITGKSTDREKEIVLRMKTVSKLFNWLGGLVIICIVLYLVLENYGVNVAPLLAGLGIIGLAFGFGGQYLIRDVINGLFVLIEGQYRINDVVKIGEHGGLVENINLRITTLRDLEGRVITIPNGEIKTVINFTKDYAQAVFDIGIAYKENVDEVMDIIKKIGKEMREDAHFGKLILADLEMLGVDDLGDSQVTIKFRIKTRPIKQWDVSREFRRRLKNRFDEFGIEIPFPHMTLYWGTGSDNDWMKEYAKNKNRSKKD